MRAFAERLHGREPGAMMEAGAMLAERLAPCGALRLLAVSGSLVRDPGARRHEDVDFFVLARRGRVWEAFFHCLWRGALLARRLGIPRTFFCFNYLVDEDHPERIDLAHPDQALEFLRLRVLFGHDAYLELLRARERELLPAGGELYRRRVREAAAAAEEESGRGTAGPGGSLVPRALVRALLPPFVLLAKAMEWRRRRRVPGARIASDAHAIRSHFHTPGGRDAGGRDGGSAEAFSALSARYDADVAASPANAHMKRVVRGTLRRLVRPGLRVLDLGCGTGADAAWLAARGALVTAVDSAPGMVREARRRVAREGLEGSVEVREGDLRETGALLRPGGYDLVLANFGPLNLAGEPAAWLAPLAGLLRPGGLVVATVMSRQCLWDRVAGLVVRRPALARRRGDVAEVRVEERSLLVRLHRAGTLAALARPHFLVRGVRGLCVVMPPPGFDGRLARMPWLSRALCGLDRLAGRLPLLREWGDHFLIVLEAR